MRGKYGDKIRLQHILEAINEIESYLTGTDFQGFIENSMMKYSYFRIKSCCWKNKKTPF
jgi:uncharacterized protein with HEPN domain